MDGEHNQYATLSRRQVALFERNPVCALAFRVCRDMCLEYGHIQFNLLKTIETADELFDYLIDHAWDPPSVKWCYHWLENQLMNSPPAVMCACATVSVSIASMDYAPEPLRSLGLDFRCLIYGDATDILDNIRSAAYQESTTISAADYGLLPDEPEEETEEIEPQEPTTPTQEDMNQQNNNSTVYNGPVSNGPVFQGCTIKVETPASPFVSQESHSDHSSSNPNGYPSSSPAPDVRTEESATPKRRGNTEKSLFINLTTTEQEKQRFLSFLREHNLSNSELDAAMDNSVTQIIVCFYRVWQQKKLLAPKAGGTAVARFVNAVCELPLTVDEKAYANILNRMIKSSEKYPDWNGDVRASFA